MDPLVYHFFVHELQKEAGLGSEIGGYLRSIPRHMWEGVKVAPGDLVHGTMDLVRNPLGAVREGAKGLVSSPGAALLNVPLTAYGIHHDMSDPNKGLGERVGRAAGNLVGSVGTMNRGLVANSVFGGMGTTMGGGAGKALDDLGHSVSSTWNQLRGRQPMHVPGAGQ